MYAGKLRAWVVGGGAFVLRGVAWLFATQGHNCTGLTWLSLGASWARPPSALSRLRVPAPQGCGAVRQASHTGTRRLAEPAVSPGRSHERLVGSSFALKGPTKSNGFSVVVHGLLRDPSPGRLRSIGSRGSGVFPQSSSSIGGLATGH